MYHAVADSQASDSREINQEKKKKRKDKALFSTAVRQMLINQVLTIKETKIVCTCCSLTFTIHSQKLHSPDIMDALTPLVYIERFLSAPFTECRGFPGTHILKRDYPVLYIVGSQAPILLKRNYPVL